VVAFGDEQQTEDGLKLVSDSARGNCPQVRECISARQCQVHHRKVGYNNLNKLEQTLVKQKTLKRKRQRQECV
jgi:hypothetical protein